MFILVIASANRGATERILALCNFLLTPIGIVFNKTNSSITLSFNLCTAGPDKTACVAPA